MLGKKVHQLLLIMALFGLFAKSLQDCPEKYGGIKGHSACAKKSSKALKSGVSESDKNTILQMHNDYRANVDPPACNMIKLYWDDDLAFVAQKWTDNCDFNHDEPMKRRIPGKFSAGQNLALGHPNWKAVIKGWHSEVKNFKFGKAKPKSVVIGHYTQLVWATTTRIGCGYTKCSDIKDFYACNYGPAGNIAPDLTVPYKKCGRQTDKLTDCKSSVCYNGGALDRKTCECICKKRKYIQGPRCSLNCSLAKDDTQWCTTSSKTECATYSNVPDDCPWKCGICPYAEYSEPRKQITTMATKKEDADAPKPGKDPASMASEQNGSIVICITLFLYVHALITEHI